MGKKSRKTPPPTFATAGTWHTHFVPLFEDMLDSLAYISLPATAKETYIIIRQQYKGPYTGNTVKCPYSTFNRYGMRNETVSKAIDILQEYGFIDIQRGGLYNRPNEYTLSERWKEIKTKEDIKKAKEKINKKRTIP